LFCFVLFCFVLFCFDLVLFVLFCCSARHVCDGRRVRCQVQA
jgi:hypothetical protein